MTLPKDMLLSRAREAEASGNLGAAIRWMEEAVALDREDVVTLVMLGHLYSDQEQYTTAIATFEEALCLQPDVASTHSGLAVALLGVRRYAEAEAALRRSIELQPTAARYVLLGSAIGLQARASDAERCYRMALQLDPGDEEAMFNLAVSIRRGNPAEALSLLQRAVEVDPRYAEAHRELGFELAGRKRFDEAEDSLRQSLSLDSQEPWTRIYLGNVLWQKGEPMKAAAMFRAACEAAPLWSVPHWLLGTVYVHLGQAEEAEKCFRTAVEAGPNDPDAAFHLGYLLLEHQAREEAQAWIDRALELDPSHLRAKEARRRLRESP